MFTLSFDIPKAILLWSTPLLISLIWTKKFTLLSGKAGCIIQVGGLYLGEIVIVEYILGMIGVLSYSIVLLVFLTMLFTSILLFKDEFLKLTKLTKTNFNWEIPIQTKIFLLFLTVFFATLALFNFLKPPTQWDFLWSNLREVAGWLQSSSLLEFHNTPLASYHANGFLYTLWFMLPFHSDLCINLQNIPLLFLISVSIYYLLKIFKLPSLISISASLVLLSFPLLFTEIWKQRVEFLLCLFMLISIVYFLGYLNNQNRIFLIISYIFLGLFVGTKTYALWYGLVIYFCYFFCLLKFRKIRIEWLYGSIVCLLLALMWPFRNYLIWGNPIYPMDVRLFNHTLFSGPGLEYPGAILRNTEVLKTTSILKNFSMDEILYQIKLTLSRYGLIGIAGILILPFEFIKLFFYKTKSSRFLVGILYVTLYLTYISLPGTSKEFGKSFNLYYALPFFVISPLILLINFQQFSTKYIFNINFLLIIFIIATLFQFADSRLFNPVYYTFFIFPILLMAYYFLFLSNRKYTIIILSSLLLSSVVLFPKFEDYAKSKRFTVKEYNSVTGVSASFLLWFDRNINNSSVLIIPPPSPKFSAFEYPLLGFKFNNQVKTLSSFDGDFNKLPGDKIIVLTSGRLNFNDDNWDPISIDILESLKFEGCRILYQGRSEIAFTH
jgi:hypothetical protein